MNEFVPLPHQIFNQILIADFATGEPKNWLMHEQNHPQIELEEFEQKSKYTKYKFLSNQFVIQIIFYFPKTI
jgi:hypothetical protein